MVAVPAEYLTFPAVGLEIKSIVRQGNVYYKFAQAKNGLSALCILKHLYRLLLISLS